MFPVAILAGGLATRLRPLTETIPKALVPIRGEPFIAHQLRLLASRGLTRVVLCLGYRAEMVQDVVGDGHRFGLKVEYSLDGPTLRGTAGAVHQAIPLLGKHFFVVYGDSYLPCDYSDIQRVFLASGKIGLMTVYRNEGRFDTSNVEFDGRVILAYDKQIRTAGMRHIDYGLGVFHSSAFASMDLTEKRDLASVYQELLRRGELAAFEVPDRFYEIGSFDGIRDLEEYTAWNL
jgi:N-acetyl-alpha-D-muramate 1-phosphate uridylyltransferase